MKEPMIPNGMRACDTCGHPVSMKAATCPKCGHQFANPQGVNLSDPVHLIGVILAVAILVLAVGAILSSF